jgi:hypothetical protein
MGRERDNREGGLDGRKRRKVRGFLAKPPSPSPSSVQNKEGRGKRLWAAGRRRLPESRATSTAGRWGKMEMAMRGINSDPHLGSGRHEEAAPQAAADWRWR